MTGTNFYKLYLIEQFRFFFENDSVAEANIAISLTLATTADYIPLILGTKHGYDVPSTLFIIPYNYLELAICGTHFGETNDPTYTAFNPVLDKLLINFVLSYSVMICF